MSSNSGSAGGNNGKKCSSFVQSFDFSYASVSLKMDKSDKYSTTAGGLCSLFMILVIAGFGAMNML